MRVHVRWMRLAGPRPARPPRVGQPPLRRTCPRVTRTILFLKRSFNLGEIGYFLKRNGVYVRFRT